MVVPILFFDFIADVVGKSGSVTIDVDFMSETTIDDIIITGRPITLQNVQEAFIQLDVLLTDLTSDYEWPLTFNDIRFDESRNKYVIVWND